MWKSCVFFLRPLIREWLHKGTHFKVNSQVSSTNPAQRFLASHLKSFQILAHAVIINISRKFSRHKHSIYKQYETTLHAKLGLSNSGEHHFHALKNSWSISRSRREIKVDINKLTKSTKTLVVRLQLACQTYQENHLSHVTLRAVITTCTQFAMFLSFPMAFSSATENYFS